MKTIGHSREEKTPEHKSSEPRDSFAQPSSHLLAFMLSFHTRLFLGTDVFTPSKEQPPKSSPVGGSSGESTDSASVSSCEFNHSETEDVCVTPVSSPEDPLKKVQLKPLHAAGSPKTLAQGSWP